MNLIKLNLVLLCFFSFYVKNVSAEVTFEICHTNDFEILIIERDYSYEPSRYIFPMKGYQVIFANDCATVLRINYSSWDTDYKFYGLLARKWIPKEKRWELREIKNLKIPESDQKVEQVDMCYPVIDDGDGILYLGRFNLDVRDRAHVESLNIGSEVDKNYIEARGKNLACPDGYRKMTSNFRLAYRSSKNEFRRLHLKIPKISFKKLTKINKNRQKIVRNYPL